MEDGLSILSSGATEARISETGATVVRFIHNHQDVFFPHQLIEGKMRGGMHFCLPWFGKSNRGEKKHGYIRDTLCRFVGQDRGGIRIYEDQRIASIVPGLVQEAELLFTLPANPGYEWPLYCDIATRVGNGLLESRMKIKRQKDGIESGAPILPGFHPYFAGDSTQTTVLVGPDQEFRGFGKKTKIIPFRGNPVTISLPGRTIEMKLGGAFLPSNSHLALWSDAPKQYFCIEPVLYPPGIFDTPEGRRLEQGEVLEVSMSLEIH